MSIYQKYKDNRGRKRGPWFIKYPIGRDPLTGEIKYKIEKVGHSKKLAERAHQKKMVEWAERKFLDIREESNMTFSQLVEWYLELPVARQAKTISFIERACRRLEEVFGQLPIREIKPSMVEEYQQQRSQVPTWCGKQRTPAGVNRELTVLKRIFNLALREDLVSKNPCWKVKLLPENNARDRILSLQELGLLLQHLPRHAALVVHFAYLTGMRAGEIFNLTWDKVDLGQRLVRLGAEDTKTSESRVIYLNDAAMELMEEAGKVRALGHNRVFTYKGHPLKSIKTCLTRACREVGIMNFRFHDLRHTFNTNLRRAGVHHSVIMKLTGHKTAAMFHRYNTVDAGDAKDAYQKLETLLSQEEQRGKPEGVEPKKCSHSAPY
jgi:integrase